MNRPSTLLAITVTVSCAVTSLNPCAGQTGEEAVDVFNAVSPSVVALKNVEGGGTGVIIDETGLILTNKHVIASPFPFTCIIDAERNGKKVTAKFRKIKIVGAHPKKDLALVRVNLREHSGISITPAKFAPGKAVQGQRVYAIGNPATGKLVLNKSITAGIISGVDRELEGVSYYQVDAAINPGNSGGPLVNSKGEVLGIVTLKFTDVDNVGFAIPMHNFSRGSFGKLERKSTNPREAQALIAQAESYAGQAFQLKGARGMQNEARFKIFSYLAMQAYREALMHDGGNWEIYFKCGIMLANLDETEAASAYLTQAINIEPWDHGHGGVYQSLGFFLTRQDKSKEAVAAWEEGVSKFPDAGKCWENLAIASYNNRDFYKACYYSSVALHVRARDLQQKNMDELRRDSFSRLNSTKQKKLNKEIENNQLRGRIAEMKNDASQFKKDGMRFVSKDFEKFILKLSNVDIEEHAEDPVAVDDGAGGNADDATPAGSRRDAKEAQPIEAAARGIVRKSDDQKQREEKAAQSILKAARRSIKQRRVSSGNSYLKRIVATYPDTDAAREARDILGIAQPSADESAETKPKPAVDSGLSGGFRNWVDKSGKHTTVAKFVDMLDNTIRLQKPDGKIIALKLNDLSKFDQQYIDKHYRK